MKKLKLFEEFSDEDEKPEQKSEFTVTKAPDLLPVDNRPSVFLAGSIEMGKAEDWQTKVQDLMKDENVSIYNPRRDDWDSSWEQTIDNVQFRTQVEWELSALERASVIIVYFDPNTKSPITLMELGLHAKSQKLMVCCPEGFFRKGNVDITCAKYGVPMFNTIEELVGAAIVKIKSCC